MIELVTNVSVGLVRVAPVISEDNTIAGGVSAAISYLSAERAVSEELLGSLSASSAPYPTLGSGEATELKDMSTKIVRMNIR